MAKGGFFDLPVLEEVDLNTDMEKLVELYLKEEQKHGKKLRKVTFFVGKGGMFHKVVVCTRSKKIYGNLLASLEGEEYEANVYEDKKLFIGCVAQEI